MSNGIQAHVSQAERQAIARLEEAEAQERRAFSAWERAQDEVRLARLWLTRVRANVGEEPEEE